jgi:ketosteroid isomerase-like protein
MACQAIRGENAMSRIRAGFCFACALVACAASGRADEHDIKAEVQRIYDQIGKAVEKKDLDGITRYSLPDATVKYADGSRLTVKEWKERARKGWVNIKKTKSRFVVEKAKSTGDAAEATYTEAHDMVVSDPKDGQEHKIGYQARWRVLLKKTAAGWRLSRSTEIERRVTRDGKLIDQLPRDKAKP